MVSVVWLVSVVTSVRSIHSVTVIQGLNLGKKYWYDRFPSLFPSLPSFPFLSPSRLPCTSLRINEYVMLCYVMGISRCNSLIVSRALCASALSCWNISQGSVATHLRWGGILLIILLQISNWVRQWKIVKIGQYLAKIWTRVYCLLFWLTV